MCSNRIFNIRSYLHSSAGTIFNRNSVHRSEDRGIKPYTYIYDKKRTCYNCITKLVLRIITNTLNKSEGIFKHYFVLKNPNLNEQ